MDLTSQSSVFTKDLSINDTFTVSSNSLFFDIDNKTLLYLYQPVIGSEAISLYLICLNYLSIENRALKIIHTTGVRLTINYICKLLKVSFNDFLIAKKKLEAVGLLKTFIDNKNKEIIFLLLPPLTPNKFFNNDFLNNALMYHLDSNDFLFTKKFFTTRRISFKNCTDISSEVSESFDKSLLENLEKVKNNLVNSLLSPNEVDSGDLSDRHYNTPNIINYEKFSYYLKVYKLENIVNDEILNFLETFKIQFNISCEDLLKEYKRFHDTEGELNHDNYLKLIDYFDNFVKQKYSNSKIENNRLEKVEELELFPQNNNFSSFLNDDNTISPQIINKINSLDFKAFYYFLFNKDLDQSSYQFLIQLKALFQISDLIINFLIFYSFVKNGFLNLGYIEKISQTIIHKNLYTSKALNKFFNDLIKKSDTISLKSQRFIFNNNFSHFFKKEE